MSSRTSLSERVAEVKAKKFLTNVLFRMVTKYSTLVGNWDEQLQEAFTESFAESFKPDPKMSIANQIRLFLRWIGYSPVEVRWDEDLLIAKIYLGTSRLWTEDIKSNKAMRVLIESVIFGSAQLFFPETPYIVTLLEKEQMPPRYQVCFQVSQRYEGVISQETDSPVIGNSLVEPILGRGIPIDAASQALSEAAKRYLEENYPETINLSRDLMKIPLKLVYVAYQKAGKEDRIEETGRSIGRIFAQKLKENFSDIAPHKAVKGIGLLPISEIEELLFYGKEKMCRGKESNIDFCVFISNVWSEFLNLFLEEEFTPMKPLCAAGSGSLCIYSFQKVVN